MSNSGFQLRRKLIFVFVDLKENESFGNSGEQPFTSYYFSGGESPWEGRLERDDDDVTTEDENEELETCNDSKTHEMVSQAVFLQGLQKY